MAHEIALVKDMGLSAPAASSREQVGWGGGRFVMPSLGNLDDYLAAVRRMPMLTEEEEALIAQQWHDHQDLEAASRLVMSHLRLVVSVARQYVGYGLAFGDLVQEGNVGLMKAVKHFDPSQKVRLFVYATYWIKAEIHEYIVKNWRMVKIATTKAQRKLFFKLRSTKHALMAPDEKGTQTPQKFLNPDQVLTVAEQLNVKPEDVRDMERRMMFDDVVLDPLPDADAEHDGFINTLVSPEAEPSMQLEAKQQDHLAHAGVTNALGQLDERSRYVVTQRWLHDDETEAKTLHTLAAELKVSAERVRQIEQAALKKMRSLLLNWNPKAQSI